MSRLAFVVSLRFRSPLKEGEVVLESDETAKSVYQLAWSTAHDDVSSAKLEARLPSGQLVLLVDWSAVELYCPLRFGVFGLRFETKRVYSTSPPLALACDTLVMLCQPDLEISPDEKERLAHRAIDLILRPPQIQMASVVVTNLLLAGTSRTMDHAVALIARLTK